MGTGRLSKIPFMEGNDPHAQLKMNVMLTFCAHIFHVVLLVLLYGTMKQVDSIELVAVIVYECTAEFVNVLCLANRPITDQEEYGTKEQKTSLKGQ